MINNRFGGLRKFWQCLFLFVKVCNVFLVSLSSIVFINTGILLCFSGQFISCVGFKV